MARRSKWSSMLALGLVAVLGAAASPATAAPPESHPFSESFVDVNPCTGDLHTVTVTGTFYEFERADGIAYRIDRIVSTSSGFSGGGTEVGIHDRIFRVTDLLTNADGDIILANGIVLIDASGNVRMNTIELTCRPRP